MIVAIKGFIGSGKTTVTELLKEEDSSFISVNGDIEVKKLYDNNMELVDKISREFNLQKIDNKLDRKTLGRIVFADQLELKKLENIVKPYIQKILDDVTKKAKDTKQNLILDCPTLDKYNVEYDYEILCFATVDTLVKRVSKRDERTEKEIKDILRTQESYYIQKVPVFTINTEYEEQKQREMLRSIKEIISVKDNWKDS